jgi:hypothetical protein
MRALVLGLLVACAGGAPRHRYPVPAEVGALVVDAEAFARFAAPLRREVEQDLAGELAVKPRKDRLFTLALLDGVAGHWPEAVARLDQLVALETDPRQRAIVGFTIRVWGAAAGDAARVPAALEQELAKLPLELVRADLGMLRAMVGTFTPEVCRALVNEHVKPAGGTVSVEDAQTIAFQRYAVVRLVPVGAAFEAALAKRQIALPE